MAKEYKKVSVFIDTNVLQSFIGSKKYVFLSNLGIPKQYYELVTFIKENHLQDYIEICISEVVFKEIRQHMINKFDSFCTNIDNDMKLYSKIAGDILENNYMIKLKKEDYPLYVDKLINDFIDNPQNMCTFVSIPSKAELMDKLLDNALRSIKHFVTQSIEGKPYKDAGFKDSIIAESIYDHCLNSGRKCLLVSDDGDFGDKFAPILNEANQFIKASSIEQAIMFLKNYYDTSIESQLARDFAQNTYWQEYLIRGIGQEYDASVTDIKVEGAVQITDELYKVTVSIVMNETVYRFIVDFDVNAKEIVDYQYKIQDD